jgi:competence protein ComEC
MHGFVAAVAHSVSIFTNGYLNRFGHPKPEVFERYQTTKSMLYRFDYNGAIEMDFVNHHHIQILSWRNRDKRYWHDSFESTN